MFKKWKFRGGGGDLREIPSVVGVWIFSGTTQCIIIINILQLFATIVSTSGRSTLGNIIKAWQNHFKN